MKRRALDLATATLQRKHPLQAMSTDLNGFLMYAHDMKRQVEATHLRIDLQPDLYPCGLFDSSKQDCLPRGAAAAR